MKEIMVDITANLLLYDYIENNKNIDDVINEMNEKFEEFEKGKKPKSYEEKLGLITMKLEILENVLTLKKFKKEKKDALKIYNLYLEQVKELGKLWE